MSAAQPPPESPPPPPRSWPTRSAPSASRSTAAWATRPGTAEAGLYFWLWPPGDLDADVLTALHADAVAYLLDLTTNPKGTAP